MFKHVYLFIQYQSTLQKISLIIFQYVLENKLWVRWLICKAYQSKNKKKLAIYGFNHENCVYIYINMNLIDISRLKENILFMNY